MNCKKAEKLIYLYDEISASERKKLVQHLAHCSKCSELMQIWRGYHNLVKGGWPVEPPDFQHADLTRDIIAALPEFQGGLNVRGRLAAQLTLSRARYAFLSLSAFLVAAFVLQSYVPLSTQPNNQHNAHVLEGSVLNTAAFFKVLRSKRAEGQTKYEACIRCWSAGGGASCPDCISLKSH